LIEFLQSRGCYVIGGVPTHWRKEQHDSKPNFIEAYKTYDMVSPWTPGRYRGANEVDNFKNNQLIPDKSFCDTNGLDYMPVVFPGFAWSTWNNGTPNHIPREAGKFLWRQAYNIKSIGLDQLYFAMFDEYDEGTAIMKAATDWSMIPTDYYFLTLSADGTWVSSDFYLRVAGAATAMLKSSATPSAALTVPHSQGPVYYRNSFEKRFTQWERNGVKGEGYENLDPCFYKDAELADNNIASAGVEIVQNEGNAKNGEFTVEVSGTPNSAESANYEYKISEVKIPVTNHLKLKFWKKTMNELGRYVSVDLHFKSGKKLSQLPDYTDNNGVSMSTAFARGNVNAGFEPFICEIGKGELLGDEIIAISVAYDKASTTGSFSAFIDDVLIATNISLFPTSINNYKKKEHRIGVERNILNFRDFKPGAEITIHDITGRAIQSFRLASSRVKIDAPNGIYIVAVKSNNAFYTQKVVLTN